jgi:hypothetical protein
MCKVNLVKPSLGFKVEAVEDSIINVPDST